MSEFQNPQNQPGIDKRVMFVFAFTMLLLLLAQQFFVKPQQQLNQQQAAKNAARSCSRSRQAECRSRRAAGEPTLDRAQAASESTTVVENDLYRITFTNRGGLVKSWILKKYKDDKGGHELELVHQQAAALYGYPLVAVELG